MAHDAEAMIERRRLRRKLTSWRLASLVLLAALIAGFAFYSLRSAEFNQPHIAKVRIEGTIFENEELLKRLDKIAGDDAVKGVILLLDSPGAPPSAVKRSTMPCARSPQRNRS